MALFIIAIGTGAIGLTLNHLEQVRLVDRQARLFGDWFEKNREHATVRHTTFSLKPEPNKNHIQLLEKRGGQWQAANVDRPRFVLPDKLEVKSADDEQMIPDIYIHPDTTYTVFNLLFVHKNEQSVRIRGDGRTRLLLGPQGQTG